MVQEWWNKNNIFMWVIVVLLVVIAVMWFFLGKMYWTTWWTDASTETNTNYEEVSVKVIKDDRATLLDVEWTVASLKELPSLSKSEFTTVDFSDEWVKEYMMENDIKFLPAIIFSTNNFDTSKDPLPTNPMTGQPNPPITQFLVELNSWEYTLLIGADFDPFLERSDRWFTLLEEEKYNKIKENNPYISWKEWAKITWIEYWDLECNFCSKLHDDGTPAKVKETYGDDINVMFQHFPLSFHQTAAEWSEILECLWEQKGSDAFYTLLAKSYADKKSTKSFLIEEAVKLWADEAKINKCLEDWVYKEKVNSQMALWVEIFWISWTPWNVLVNNETWEYEIISWAYPYEAFKEIIDKLK